MKNFKCILCVILFLFSASFFLYSKDVDEVSKMSIRNIVRLNKIDSTAYTLVIVRLQDCISCDISRLFNIVNILKANEPKSNVALVIESELEHDALYLQNDFPEISIYEDNSEILTNKLNSNVIIVKGSADTNPTILKFANIDEASYTIEREYFHETYKISENGGFLSNILLVTKSNNDVIIFDGDCKQFFTFSIKDSTTKNDTLKVLKNQFYSGDINILKKSNFKYQELIIDAVYDERTDIFYILYHNILRSIEIDRNGVFGYHFEPLICKYSTKVGYISSNFIPIDNFNAMFLEEKELYFQYLQTPNYNPIDTNAVISKYNYDDNQFTKVILNDEYLKSKIIDLNEIASSDFENSCLFALYFNKGNEIQLYSNGTIKLINLSGLFKKKNNLKIHDLKIIDSLILFTFSDSVKFYIQTYSIKNGVLLKENILNISQNNQLISSRLFYFSDDKLYFLNRYHKSRWLIQTYLYVD